VLCQGLTAKSVTLSAANAKCIVDWPGIRSVTFLHLQFKRDESIINKTCYFSNPFSAQENSITIYEAFLCSNTRWLKNSFYFMRRRTRQRQEENHISGIRVYCGAGWAKAPPPHSLITSKIHAEFEYYLRLCQRQDHGLTDRARSLHASCQTILHTTSRPDADSLRSRLIDGPLSDLFHQHQSNARTSILNTQEEK
jgi:hypothetical protein